jgi:hypothetical protein
MDKKKMKTLSDFGFGLPKGKSPPSLTDSNEPCNVHREDDIVRCKYTAANGSLCNTSDHNCHRRTQLLLLETSKIVSAFYNE